MGRTRNSLSALDIRGVLLGDPAAPEVFTVKRDATAKAKELGWLAGDVFRVANRFQAFWVVGQSTIHGDGTSGFTLLCRDGGFRFFNLSWKGF